MENIQIPITENGTVTLAAAGKYCDRNIDINVEVEGGGGEVALETVKLTFVNNKSFGAVVVAYLNSNAVVANLMVTPGPAVEVNAAKNTIVAFGNLQGCTVECSDKWSMVDTNTLSSWFTRDTDRTYTFTDIT